MSELYKRILTSLILVLIILFSFKNFIFICITIFCLNIIALYEFSKIFKKIYIKNKFKQFIAIIFSQIYMIYFSLVIIFYLIGNFEAHKYLIFFLLTICISTDIGGFVFGKTIGGKKLTKISPNKTYSGLVGSFVTSILTGYIFFVMNPNLVYININIFVLIFLLSLISQIGDLAISLLKRIGKIKDTGSILPGHGGLLDRIDGILLTLPFGIIIITYVS